MLLTRQQGARRARPATTHGPPTTSSTTTCYQLDTRTIAGAAKAPVLVHRETARGVGAARVPPRSRAEGERDHAKGPQEQADSVLWLEASSHCYWRAAGRSSGEGDRRRWRPTPTIPVRMASTRMQIRTGTSTTVSGQESSWCQLLSTEPEAEPEIEMVGTRITPEVVRAFGVLVCYWHRSFVVVVVQHWW